MKKAIDLIQAGMQKVSSTPIAESKHWGGKIVCVDTGEEAYIDEWAHEIAKVRACSPESVKKLMYNATRGKLTAEIYGVTFARRRSSELMAQIPKP